jgi:hypothetical protein
LSPIRRLWLLRGLALTGSLVLGAAGVAGYAAYRELRLSYDYCGPYGAFDEELGWRLRAGAVSCLSLRNQVTGHVIFDTRIYVNADGFRDAAPEAGGDELEVLAIGDSWTFGYGVEYEESYPAVLGRLAGVGVANAGVPAYGSAANLLLLERILGRRRPAVVLYLAKGLWTRSICGVEAAARTLVPCFGPDGSGAMRIVRPARGAVAAAVAGGAIPGGAFTAGHSLEISARLKRRMAHDLDGLLAYVRPRPRADADDERLVRLALRTEVATLRDFAERFRFVLVLVDPVGVYKPVIERLAGPSDRLVYVGRAEWVSRVESRFSQLPADRVLIPEDFHYTSEAQVVLAEALVAPVRTALAQAASDRDAASRPPSR